MKQAIYLFVIFIVVSLSNGCAGNTEPGSNSNEQNPVSNSVAKGQSNAGNFQIPRSGRPELRFVEAPEDSQIAQATQNGKLYEQRIWKKHPKLLKVESTTLDEKNKSLSIVLRSAQVVNITTDRIPNVKLATAEQFLKLANSAPDANRSLPKTESNTTK